MRAGSCRTLATIKRPYFEKDARGEDAPALARVSQIWVDLRQLAGREREAALQVVSESTWRAFSRFSPGLMIRTTDQLHIDGRVFDVLAVIDLDNRHQTWQIELKENTNG